MKVLIESGATKSDWRVLGPDGKQVRQFLRGGMNVSAMRLETVKATLAEAIREEGLEEAEGVYLYTAGVVTDAIRSELTEAIRQALGASAPAGAPDIDIQDDLVGAARAVCGPGSGIVAILGTGSNTCFYDGQNIHRKVYSGGYVIGDEGGGAVLGKLFLSDYIKGLVPEPVAGNFAKAYDASYAGIVENVYRSASPSGYLGSLAPFLLEHQDDAYVKALIDKNFQAFIDRSLLRYDVARYPVGVVGGFGWACRDILTPLLEEAGIRVSRFLKAPVEGLCGYHG